MSQLNLPSCPICFAEDSLSRKTLERAGQSLVWYECQECGSALLWLGDDQWAFQKVGKEEKSHLLKQRLTGEELQGLLLNAEDNGHEFLVSTQAVEHKDAGAIGPEMHEMRVCPYCAETIKAEAIVCRYCNRPMPGHEVDVPSVVATQLQTPAKPKPKGRALFFFLLVLAIVGAFVIAVYLLNQSGVLGTIGVQILPTTTPTPVPTAEPCHIQAQFFVKEVEAYFDDWDDANKLAGSTSRIALSPVISRLQDIRRNVAAVDYPACAGGVRQIILDYMDETISGYLAFMADEADSIVKSHFEKASESFDLFEEQFSKLKLGLEPFD